ncbi:DUF1269 domain-containing family protein [Pseudonocardia sulfidoxydans NBRC 16205]|uniref:DUF1269 domain-containing family protein n=1 Tax=Pseudonocardia sulfidoxydans NBRC 16205 TaxID=1223511 RepID=A0A511D8I2_9PSEU|nr:DUF6325 family protein [Pseudonocardia sulfidoxydans]GEL21092.1 DUF1269 domain-containing family protein [Pseudonocardia sulfidoxydans NBRC 16205]
MRTGLGPIEIMVISFPGSRFNGTVLDEVRTLVDRDVVNIVDGLLIRKGLDGVVDFVEFDQLGLEDDVAPLAALVGEVVHDLVSAEDVMELAAGVEPGSSAALVVFEHEWVKPLRTAIVDSGGVLVADTRVPGPVVDAVLDALRATGSQTDTARSSS